MSTPDPATPAPASPAPASPASPAAQATPAPASPADPVTLDTLNGWPADLAQSQLLSCCSSARWADEVASGRPYRTAEELLARSDAAVARLDQADLEQALAGHPRIGAAPTGATSATSAWSQREQAGVRGADPATIQALADGNAKYERRFGHIYLVCATGRSAAELLALLEERLGHDPGTEWGVVRGELGKINRIRLRRRLEGGSQ
jgi:2-oxo-4-hydroxy-4-carboxy-5-ureidoimidazoline decarboxylase